MLRIGIDIGGTFTDFVVYDSNSGQIKTFKILSDPLDPSKTVLDGFRCLKIQAPADIVHGSTVATNALLERKGARTALVTTLGFKDVLQIGRQNRPELYDWTAKPTEALVPPDLRFEVNERIDRNGAVQVALDPVDVEKVCDSIMSLEVESVAICLLFSFLHPDHESAIAQKLRELGLNVSVSSEILPEFREYERMSTTVINAYVSPILERYLSKLSESLAKSHIQIMQSSGGMISLEQAKRNGARCILSGPAGGIVGAYHMGKAILKDLQNDEVEQEVKLLTFDMGGTSTDVSLINGKPGFTNESKINGLPIHLPILNIHTIGAGGGSIAYVDAGGALRVGPKSAGAYPGPACYGSSEFPTVTDANLVLGRLLPEYFLGGEMPIYPERSFSAFEMLGKILNMTPIQAAKGVIDVVNAQMEHALRVISIERGYDPRDYSLLSFGGAGGLHAIMLARQMSIPRVIVPKFAATLSAFGMLSSDVIKDYVKTVMLPGTTDKAILASQFTPLRNQGEEEIKSEGIPAEKIELQLSIDARYAGQSYELNIPFSDRFMEDFESLHKFTYGYFYPAKNVEIVNLRVRAVGKVQPVVLPKPDAPVLTQAIHPKQNKRVELKDGPQTVPVYQYDNLPPSSSLVGPALIVSKDTTILLDKAETIQVDRYQNLVINLVYI